MVFTVDDLISYNFEIRDYSWGSKTELGLRIRSYALLCANWLQIHSYGPDHWKSEHSKWPNYPRLLYIILDHEIDFLGMIFRLPFKIQRREYV